VLTLHGAPASSILCSCWNGKFRYKICNSIEKSSMLTLQLVQSRITWLLKIDRFIKLAGMTDLTHTRIHLYTHTHMHANTHARTLHPLFSTHAHEHVACTLARRCTKIELLPLSSSTRLRKCMTCTGLAPNPARILRCNATVYVERRLGLVSDHFFTLKPRWS
jgi:hypothetical protein